MSSSLPPYTSSRPKKKPKFFDWHDIQRILEGMRSKELDGILKGRNSDEFAEEYLALFSCWFAISEYFLNHKAPFRAWWRKHKKEFRIVMDATAAVGLLITEWFFTSKVTK